MTVRATHEFVDHTSEVTLRARAPSFPELVTEVTRAFTELVPERLKESLESGWQEIHLAAPDRVSVLVEWLNELVYRAEVDSWMPVDLVVEIGDGEGGAALAIRARGIRLTAPFVLVKAATLHGARVQECEGGFEGEVTLDV